LKGKPSFYNLTIGFPLLTRRIPQLKKKIDELNVCCSWILFEVWCPFLI
jgi:hypothetical protein